MQNASTNNGQEAAPDLFAVMSVNPKALHAADVLIGTRASSGVARFRANAASSHLKGKRTRRMRSSIP
jgi:hypothetical protein